MGSPLRTATCPGRSSLPPVFCSATPDRARPRLGFFPLRSELCGFLAPIRLLPEGVREFAVKCRGLFRRTGTLRTLIGRDRFARDRGTTGKRCCGRKYKNRLFYKVREAAESIEIAGIFCGFACGDLKRRILHGWLFQKNQVHSGTTLTVVDSRPGEQILRREPVETVDATSLAHADMMGRCRPAADRFRRWRTRVKSGWTYWR